MSKSDVRNTSFLVQKCEVPLKKNDPGLPKLYLATLNNTAQVHVQYLLHHS